MKPDDGEWQKRREADQEAGTHLQKQRSLEKELESLSAKRKEAEDQKREEVRRRLLAMKQKWAEEEKV
jgi:hypothetical protein